MPFPHARHARRLVPVVTGFLLLGARFASALDPAKAVTQYSLAAWQTEEGLPHNLVQAIAQTPDGYLWLATQEGLARFDGVRFTVFDRRSTAAMTANDVETIYVSRDGSLWVGNYGGTLLRYQNGRFRSYSSREGLYSATISALAEDTHGDLWIGTDGDGLYRLHEGGFTRYTQKDGLIDDSVRCLVAGREGSLWIGTPSGLGRKRADGFERYALPARELPVAVSALTVDGQVTKFSQTGTQLLQFQINDGTGFSLQPYGLAVAATDGSIYVSNAGSSHVSRFSSIRRKIASSPLQSCSSGLAGVSPASSAIRATNARSSVDGGPRSEAETWRD